MRELRSFKASAQFTDSDSNILTKIIQESQLRQTFKSKNSPPKNQGFKEFNIEFSQKNTAFERKKLPFSKSAA